MAKQIIVIDEHGRRSVLTCRWDWRIEQKDGILVARCIKPTPWYISEVNGVLKVNGPYLEVDLSYPKIKTGTVRRARVVARVTWKPREVWLSLNYPRTVGLPDKPQLKYPVSGAFKPVSKRSEPLYSMAFYSVREPGGRDTYRYTITAEPDGIAAPVAVTIQYRSYPFMGAVYSGLVFPPVCIDCKGDGRAARIYSWPARAAAQASTVGELAEAAARILGDTVVSARSVVPMDLMLQLVGIMEGPHRRPMYITVGAATISPGRVRVAEEAKVNGARIRLPVRWRPGLLMAEHPAIAAGPRYRHWGVVRENWHRRLLGVEMRLYANVYQPWLPYKRWVLLERSLARQQR